MSWVSPIDNWLALKYANNHHSITLDILILSFFIGGIIIPDCWILIKYFWGRPKAIKRLWELRGIGIGLVSQHHDGYVSSAENWKTWFAGYNKFQEDFEKDVPKVSVGLKNEMWTVSLPRILELWKTLTTRSTYLPPDNPGLSNFAYMYLNARVNLLDEYLQKNHQ